MNKIITSIGIISFLLLFGMINAQTISVPSTIYANSTFPIAITGIPNTNSTVGILLLDVAGNSYPVLYINTTATTFGFINSTGNYTITAYEMISNSTTQIASTGVSVLPNPSDVIQANLYNLSSYTSNSISSLNATLNATLSNMNSTISNLTTQLAMANSTISDLSNASTSLSNTIQTGLSITNANITSLNAYAQNLTNYTVNSFSYLNTNILPSITSAINATNTKVANDYNSNNALGITALVIGIIGVAIWIAVFFLKGKKKKLTPKEMALNIAQNEITQKQEFEESLKGREAERNEFKSAVATFEEIKKSKEYKKLEKDLQRAEEMARRNGVQVERQDLPEYKNLLGFLTGKGLNINEIAKETLAEKIRKAEAELAILKDQAEIEKKKSEIANLRAQLDGLNEVK